MRKRFLENLQYVVLAGVILGQCTVGANFYLGQFIYLVCNAVSVFRDFELNRPTADKIKDVCCSGITLGLILFNYFIKKY